MKTLETINHKGVTFKIQRETENKRYLVYVDEHDGLDRWGKVFNRKKDAVAWVGDLQKMVDDRATRTGNVRWSLFMEAGAYFGTLEVL